MRQEVKIRRGVPADASMITEFNLRLACESEGLQLDTERLRRGVEAVVEGRSESFYLVAETGATLAGQLMLTREWSDWRNGWIYWIQSVFVAEDFRRRGIFRQLFTAAKDYVTQAQDAVGLRLYVEEYNTPAQETYSSLGLSFSGYRVMEWLTVEHPRRERHQ